MPLEISFSVEPRSSNYLPLYYVFDSFLDQREESTSDQLSHRTIYGTIVIDPRQDTLESLIKIIDPNEKIKVY